MRGISSFVEKHAQFASCDSPPELASDRGKVHYVWTSLVYHVIQDSRNRFSVLGAGRQDPTNKAK